MNLRTFGFLCSALLLLSLTSPLTAQTTFQRAYGGTEYDCGYSAQQTADGGYVIAGSNSTGSGWSDLWLIKTDSFGDTMWTRTYGGADDDEGYSVTQTTDGGYVIAGHTYSFGAGYYDVYLVKTDASGDTLWTHTYGGATDDYGYSVLQTMDGGYVIAGETRSFGAGDEDVYLVKTDSYGDTLWTRTYGGTSYDGGYSVQQTADGGYIIAGYTDSFGAGREDVWLIRTDALGDTVWTRAYGGTADDHGRSVAQTADGGYVIAGWTSSFGAGYSDVHLIKTDAAGDTMWTRTWGGADRDNGYSVAQTTDGGYVITGRTSSFGAGSNDAWLIKTDASGDTMWTCTHGGSRGERGYSVRQTADGGYIIAGYTYSLGAGNSDIYLVKTDSAGNCAAIAEPEPPVAHKPAPATIARAVLHVSGRSGVLLDISGREVAKLQPGDNDVRHLSPGVYFIRPASSVGREASSVRKVILTR